MLSIVVCSINVGKFSTFRAHLQKHLKKEKFEIVAIHDARSMAEGYNRGLQQSRGEVVVFCHDDLEILTPHFHQRLMTHLRCCDVLGVMGTSRLVGTDWRLAGMPHVFGHVARPFQGYFDVMIFGAHRPLLGGMMALDGLFLAFRRPVIEALRWDEETFTGFHGCETDVTLRAFLAGHRVAVASDIGILHESQVNPMMPSTADPTPLKTKLERHFLPLPQPQPQNSLYAIARCKTKEAAAIAMNLPAWKQEAP
jgi:hypothetical protein